MNGLVDTHLHTAFSHDSKAVPEKVCEVAIERALKGITITDHCDVELLFFGGQDGVVNSVKKARELRSCNEGKLEVFAGVEMGFSEESFDTAKRIIESLGEIDQVIYSVHCLKCKGKIDAFSRMDFSSWSDSEIYDYLSVYFDTVSSVVNKCDTDILPHLTCPLKYLNKQGIEVDLSRFDGVIEQILEVALKRDIALELNASSIVHESVIDKYLLLGGRKFTIASDAHAPQFVANDFDKWTSLLKEKGIDEVYYFRKRKPIAVKI